ncbi:hypothetical protein KAR34_00815 [bacterium]|nr:hypothetical protein [bacterium]
MKEKKVITLSEFKTVVEDIKSDIKRVTEVMLHEFGVAKEERTVLKEQMGILTVAVNVLKTDVSTLKTDVSILKTDVSTLKEQSVLLHEGQTEIKNELKQKVGRDEFAKLEVRVARLESKAA